jgi:thiol-disulfide isomerase/thioredoxin
VVKEFGGEARFVEENYGDSELAKRFGVTRYPAIFVDDVLVATPNDFGFYGKGESESGGRYAPLQTPESHARFRADLSRTIGLILEGRPEEARREARPAADAGATNLPDFSLTDLEGAPITRQELRGRVVIVDFWAPWCPPCRTTLRWLEGLKRQYGDRLIVLALAVQSDPEKVRAFVGGLGQDLRWAMGTPEAARAFGDVSALPTLLLFDREGRSTATFFGAPPTLHADAEAKIASLMN